MIGKLSRSAHVVLLLSLAAAVTSCAAFHRTALDGGRSERSRSVWIILSDSASLPDQRDQAREFIKDEYTSKYTCFVQYDSPSESRDWEQKTKKGVDDQDIRVFTDQKDARLLRFEFDKELLEFNDLVLVIVAKQPDGQWASPIIKKKADLTRWKRVTIDMSSDQPKVRKQT